MEFVMISTLLVAAMATVDIQEPRPDSEAEGTGQDQTRDRSYGVHG